MKASKRTNPFSSITWLIIGILAFVAFLVVGFAYLQNKYSHRVKSISINLSSGPVSPEFQQTTEVLITKDSCKISVTKQSGTETADCPMDGATFSKVQSAINEYGVIDKIIAKSDQKSQLIGGKVAKLTITLVNGDSYTATLTQEFVENLGPFFEELGLLVPSFDSAIPSQ